MATRSKPASTEMATYTSWRPQAAVGPSATCTTLTTLTVHMLTACSPWTRTAIFMAPRGKAATSLRTVIPLTAVARPGRSRRSLTVVHRVAVEKVTDLMLVPEQRSGDKHLVVARMHPLREDETDE